MLSPRHTDYDPVQMEASPHDEKPQAGPTNHSFDERDHIDSLSYHSNNPFSNEAPSYPPPPSGPPSFDPSPQPQRPHFRPIQNPTHPGQGRNSSWDLLSAGVRKWEHSYDQFDSAKASQQHLAFADGDLPKTKIVRLYNYLLNVSIVTRWTLFIIPVAAVLWVPGILSLTKFPNAKVWSIKLVWWSIWLSVVWVGWWAVLAGSMLLPHLVRYTLGVVAVGIRRYIDWLIALRRYVALFGWTLTIWIVWNPVIDARQDGDASTRSKETIDLIGKLLFGIYLCAGVLLFEKFSIQWIAAKFHERSYAERIADQKFAVRVLTTLYRHSSDIPGRSDTLKDSHVRGKSATLNPRKFVKRALKGVRFAATTTTTALGNVASEIAGSSVLQPNSPQAMVQTALASANKTRLLARRLFYSFCKPGRDVILVTDIAPFFQDPMDANLAFLIFDKDSNGDVSREEMELSCLECHREQLSIEHSMRDLDSAVGRLDNIFMSLYVVVAILIIAVTLEAQLATLITGAGTIILGLSWLIGGSLSEVLTSIIFLFIKHPFDVGDRVVVDGKHTYTVKEIRLLSTIFVDSNNTLVQAPNLGLNSVFIQNIRRSGQMSESFTFDVGYDTTFEQIERLRALMLDFVSRERRDYQPQFDVVVVDFPEQDKMTLSADIMYKSNWQQGGLKAKRRNKWICALKGYLADTHIFGPAGNPHKPPDTAKYTLVPWDEFKHEEPGKTMPAPSPRMPSGGWNLTNNDELVAGDDVFDEGAEVCSLSACGILSARTQVWQ
ncbi:Mechanosensitive ion channel-domain-containing protein [Amylostereum chailletii]|nr:Mechanosensitive ion channel-domain-containing protein [Amylostereum chailletii]